MSFSKLTDEVYMLEGKEQALVYFARRDANYADKDYITDQDIEFVKWGDSNVLVNEMVMLADRNHLKPMLLEKEIDFIHGQGLAVFKETYEGGKREVQYCDDRQARAFLESFDSDAYWERCCHNYAYSGNAFAGIPLNAMGKIPRLDVQDVCNTRVAKLKAGEANPSCFIVADDWYESLGSSNPSQIFPTWQEPGDGVAGWTYSILHMKREQTGQSYYGKAPWWGTKAWTEVSNFIPLYHGKLLKTEYKPKFLIRIPKYMVDMKAAQIRAEGREGLTEKDFERVARTEMVSELDGTIGGLNNAGKNIGEIYETTASGEPRKGIIIEPIGRTASDKDYIELDNQANLNQAAGHGISQSIAGTDAGNGNMKGSGSEKRTDYATSLALSTARPRRKLLRPFGIVAKVNNWPPGVFIGVADTELTTLDRNPTGRQAVVHH